MVSNALSALQGWGVGYNVAICKTKEDEIKQGKNYYLASIFQWGQINHLSTVVSRIAFDCLKNGKLLAARIATNVIPVVAIPTIAFSACVTHGHYGAFAGWYNNNNWTIGTLPQTIGPRAQRVCNFISEYIGDIVRVAMVASCVALVALGHYYYVAALALAITYQAVDQLGYVPRKISLFMETYMPVVANVASLIGGTLVTRILDTVAIVFQCSTTFNRFVQHKVDNFVHKVYGFTHATLEDCDAPLVQNRELSYDDIKGILNAPSHKYSINPAHCGTSVMQLYNFSESRKFEEFLPLFDKINWSEKYSIIKAKLLDDDRFMMDLKKWFPDISRDNFDAYITLLASETKQSNEAYLAAYVKSQMATLVSYLKGEKRITGMQRDLDDAITNCAKILPYLQQLDVSIELEDALLKLAVEGGDYCARGAKRASTELLDAIAYKRAGVATDPREQYEMQLFQKLQEKRYFIMQQAYNMLGQILPQAVHQDIHGQDIYRIYMALGFYPVSEHERNNEMGLIALYAWEKWGDVRNAMYQQYKSSLDTLIADDIGEQHFAIYLRDTINSNSKLTAAQKEELIDMYTECNEDKETHQPRWTLAQTQTKFHRLACVMLGILRPVA